MISFYTRALLLIRRPPCWNKHGAPRTTPHDTARHVDSHDMSCLSCRDVWWHDATSGIWAYPHMKSGARASRQLRVPGKSRSTGLQNKLPCGLVIYIQYIRAVINIRFDKQKKTVNE